MKGTMMNKVTITVFAVALCMTSALAGRWEYVDTTLEYYLSRSEVVVECTVTKCEVGQRTASGLVDYECEINVSDAIRGDIKTNESLRIIVPRWRQHDKTVAPGPTPGKRYIVFLKDKRTLADIWFGIQPYDELMSGRLKALVAENNKEIAPTKPSTATE
jgi:hypothetical protein